ncbi:MAG: hypothetical protein LVR00_08635 [Rhabdochlamydiaceae bacterium]|jgi:hypothetical protein
MTIEQIPIGKFGYVKKHIVDWFSSRVNLIVVGSLGLLALLIAGGPLINWAKGGSQLDYIQAESVCSNWEVTKDGLAQLQKLMHKHPELHQKYDSVIAQKFLSSSQSGLAATYASATLKRIGEFSPYYTKFATGSLMIAEGHLKEALEDAKNLKMQLAVDNSFWSQKSQIAPHGSLLYAYNLLRIATLEKELGSPEGELAAWKELKQNAGWGENKIISQMYDPEAYFLIQQNFKKQDISLLDYINHREAIISSGNERSR